MPFTARIRLALLSLSAACFMLGTASLAVIVLLDPMADRFHGAHSRCSRLHASGRPVHRRPQRRPTGCIRRPGAGAGAWVRCWGIALMALQMAAQFTTYALIAVLSVTPAVPAAATGLLAVWAVVAMLFQAPQQKRLVGLSPDHRGVLLAMNALALYLGMSIGAFSATRTCAAWGAAALPIASIALIALACVALALSHRSARRERRCAGIGTSAAVV